jgi:hypothetical protein
MFTGQAIINKSCAGCHGSKVTGAGRQGAPAGLDFDLIPLTNGTVVNGSTGGVAGVSLDPKELAGLRSRQRKVYDEREMIWEQVEKDLMPPKGATSFRDLSNFFKSMFSSGDMSCTRGQTLGTLDGVNREEFRKWLACDTPIIEATSDKLTYKALPAGSSPADSAAGAGYYSVPGVSIGYQYPSCGGGGSGGAVDFTQIYNNVLAKSANMCLSCHTGAASLGNFDIGTIEKAWTTLLGTGMGGASTCAATPVYVKPGDPNASYLLNMVVPSKMRCTPSVMPLGSTTGLPAADVDLITRWIMAGAPRNATAGGGADAGVDGGP